MTAAALLFAAAQIAASCLDAERALADAAESLSASDDALEAAWVAASRQDATWRRARGERAARLLSAACAAA